MLGIIAFLSFASTQPTPVAGKQPAPLNGQYSQESLAAARGVVASIYSEASQLQAANVLVRKHQERSVRQNAEFRRLERLHPGFIDAALDQIRAGYRSHALRLLPEFRERIAMLYASQLSATELNDLHGFYVSGPGSKIVAGMARHADSSALIRERAAGEDSSASSAAIATDQRSAAQNAVKDLRPSDFDAILALRDKPYFARLMALRDPVTKVHREFASRPPAVVSLRADEIIAKLKRKGAAHSR